MDIAVIAGNGIADSIRLLVARLNDGNNTIRILGRGGRNNTKTDSLVVYVKHLFVGGIPGF